MFKFAGRGRGRAAQRRRPAGPDPARPAGHPDAALGHQRARAPVPSSSTSRPSPRAGRTRRPASGSGPTAPIPGRAGGGGRRAGREDLPPVRGARWTRPPSSPGRSWPAATPATRATCPRAELDGAVAVGCWASPPRCARTRTGPSLKESDYRVGDDQASASCPPTSCSTPSRTGPTRWPSSAPSPPGSAAPPCRPGRAPQGPGPLGAGSLRAPPGLLHARHPGGGRALRCQAATACAPPAGSQTDRRYAACRMASRPASHI